MREFVEVGGQDKGRRRRKEDETHKSQTRTQATRVDIKENRGFKLETLWE